MKNSKVLKTILFISGLIAAAIGLTILITPVTFYAGNGIDLDNINPGNNASLLNEIRAGGSGLLATGVLIMSGAFVASLTFTATVVSILLYLSYGLSRIFSMAIDGMPAEGLMIAAIAEIITGLAGVFALLKYREHA